MEKKYKLSLSQIVKNESHVIERMLNSIKPIVDCLVIVDTGSTDNTKEVIENWGKLNNIPTFIYDRPFDNFENSRNFAMEKVKEVSEYAFWLDADEILIIDEKFDKSRLNKDLYMFNTYINTMKYTRNECWKTSKNFRWYGPVHEFIVCDDKDITSGLMEGLTVKVQMDGGSWKGDVPTKYKKHAEVLEDYITNKDRNARWVFYTAQSWHDSACVPNSREENEERLRRALLYYQERVNRNDGYEEERFYSQLRVSTIKKILEHPWSEVHQELLKAYAMEPLRSEPFKVMIDHYLSIGEWNLAYLYSKFCKINFHGKNPYPKRLLFLDETLYMWRLLESHIAASFYTGRKEEANENFRELQSLIKNNPQWFTQEEVNKINSNAPHFQ